jgi:hypothetical protein
MTPRSGASALASGSTLVTIEAIAIPLQRVGAGGGSWGSFMAA